MLLFCVPEYDNTKHTHVHLKHLFEFLTGQSILHMLLNLFHENIEVHKDIHSLSQSEYLSCCNHIMSFEHNYA